MTGVSITNKGGSFSCTLPRNKEKDGQSITIRVSKPAARQLYVTEQYAAIDDTPLVSSTGIPYKDGIAISSEDDLKALMKAGNNSAGKSYSSRSETYVITENIKCNSKVAFSSASFTGKLDGDYHTVTGLQNPLFKDIGKNATMAVICNLIFNNAAIDTSASTSSTDDSAAVLSQTVSGNTRVSRVFISQAYVLSGWHSGNVFGRINENSKTVTVD